MPIDPKKIAETTGYGNNCSFHCVAHFLSDELEEGTNEALSKAYAEPGYKIFVERFRKHYDIKTPITFHFLKHLVKKYTNPLDREAIFGPVLRETLVEIMKHKGPTDTDVMLFRSDVAGFLESKDRARFWKSAPFWLKANRDWLEKNADKLTKMNPQTLENTLNEFYPTEGFYKFTDYLGDPKIQATISPEELSFLTTQLNIALKVFSKDNEQESYSPNFNDKHKTKRVLTVFNGGFHWEYEAANEDVALVHNQPYKSMHAINEKLKVASTSPQDIEKLAKESGAAFSSILVPTSDEKTQKEITKLIKEEFSKYKPDVEIKKDHKETKEPKQETKEPKPKVEAKDTKTETKQTPEQSQGQKPGQTQPQKPGQSQGPKPGQTQPQKPGQSQGPKPGQTQGQAAAKPPTGPKLPPGGVSTTATGAAGSQQQHTNLALEALRKRKEMLERQQKEQEEKKKIEPNKTNKPK